MVQAFFSFAEQDMNDSAPSLSPAKLDALVQEAGRDFAAATAPAELENAKARYLGKAGRITELLKALGRPRRTRRRLAAR